MMEDKVITTIELITPEKASEMLSCNVKNRRLRSSWVKQYSDEMRKGRWRVNVGEPLVFTKDGRLIDGQHRLQAVVKSGMAVRMAVCRDADDEDFIVIDTGVKRTSADILSLAETPNYKRICTAIRNFWLLKDERISTKNIPSTRSLYRTNEDMLNEYSSSPELYQSAILFATHICNKRAFLNVGEIAGEYVLLIKERHHDKEKVEHFFRELAFGNEYPSIVYVRSRIINSCIRKTKRGKLDAQERRVLTAKAWNIYLRDDKRERPVISRVEEKAIFD